MNSKLYSSTFYAATYSKTALTIEHVERIMKVAGSLGPEPIGEWMRKQNCPPEQWNFVLPQRLKDEWDGPEFWPSYVLFSPLVPYPVFVRRVV